MRCFGTSVIMKRVYVGTAGWSLRREHFNLFPAAGTHLTRYAARFNTVEINSSFYRPHRHSTYQRWAASTPDDFLFSVKIPRQITHLRRLKCASDLVDTFLDQVAGLGHKLGALLIQLPPSCSFDISVVRSFFSELRSRVSIALVCEPRHASWFTTEADDVLQEQHVNRAVVDPQVYANPGRISGTSHAAYFRWHGSPRIYYSKYDQASLQSLANQVNRAVESVDSVWCIFDNTADGAATENALELFNLLRGGPPMAALPTDIA
jgi:uncharacterized protein YecE (DUF72 family)